MANLSTRLDGPWSVATPAATATLRNMSTVTTAAAATPIDPMGLAVSPFSWSIRAITGNAVTVSMAAMNRVNPNWSGASGEPKPATKAEV